MMLGYVCADSIIVCQVNNNSLHLADFICSEKRTVFRSSSKTVSYEEQIMSKDKYSSIFSPQMEAIVFIILQVFFATREFLKIGEYSRIFSSICWGIFGHEYPGCQRFFSRWGRQNIERRSGEGESRSGEKKTSGTNR